MDFSSQLLYVMNWVNWNMTIVAVPWYLSYFGLYVLLFYIKNYKSDHLNTLAVKMINKLGS